MIVSNTTPISNLVQLGLIELLHELFGTITIPGAVASELNEGREFLGDWHKACGDTVRIVAMERDPLTEQLLLNLHPGEAEAIALGVRHKAKILLCDDLEARKVAVYHGLKVTGTLGILVKARLDGLIQAVTPQMDRLRKEVHFWFTEELYHQIRSLVREDK